MSTAALLLGSNVGDRLGYLDIAIKKIGEQAGNVSAASSLYETAPWGNTDQNSFINQAILIETNLSPEILLKTILDIEMQIGRKRLEKWGPRIIDIDILYYDDLVISEDDLKVPHPYMQDRRFSLVPLNEISPAWVHPVFHKTASQMLDDNKDEAAVLQLTIKQD
jgi:2-amino-4-hydroxy-6-hydroxymethyldihydropteridine diphosphokinase